MNGEKGFTLLEVMAALAIMVIALVPILENQALNVKLTERAYATTQATLLAASKLAEYSAIEYPEHQKDEGSFDLTGYENFSYLNVKQDTGFPGVGKNLLTIRWGKKVDERLEVTTFVVKKFEK